MSQQHTTAQIAYIFRDIPPHFPLTPTRYGNPYRKGWNREQPLLHTVVFSSLSDGKDRWNGVGVRTGNVFNGCLAIHITGASALRLWQAVIEHFGPLPLTVTWNNGQADSLYLLLQIPPELQPQLQDLNRVQMTHFPLNPALVCEGKEAVEFCYNTSVSALPPSYYAPRRQSQWVHSPAQVPIADAPVWLVNLIKQVWKTPKLKPKAGVQSPESLGEVKELPSIRQLLPYLKECHPTEQDGLLTFNCPLHEEDGKQAIEVNEAGEMKAHCGCSVEEVYNGVLGLALDRGFTP